MQAIINIELDDKVSTGSIEDRYHAVLATVRKFFTRALGEVREAEYQGPDGPVRERTAVIQFEFHADKNIVLMAMNQVAKTYNQDCVAVLFSDGEGRLVGPEADRWGGFKLEYFKAPSVVDLFKVAA